MEWQIVGYCAIPLSLIQASFGKTVPRDQPSIVKESLHLTKDPVCKMALKNKGCSQCRLRSCCARAERNARLFLQGKIPSERFEELSDDLNNTCEIAFTYQNWLLSMIKNGDLPLENKRLHTRFKERKEIIHKMGVFLH